MNPPYVFKEKVDQPATGIIVHYKLLVNANSEL